MHELSIALGILDAAGEEAARRQARIVAIHLKLGAMSGVVKDALASAFELARTGSDLQDSRLVIEEVATEVYCSHCEADRPVQSIQLLACSVCGTPAAKVVRGRELEIVALEIES